MTGPVPQQQPLPAARLTDPQLERLAEDVTYVVETFAYAVDEVERLRARGEDNSHAFDVHVEAAAVLARALHDFLCANGTKPDDLFAVHYAPNWTNPTVLSRDLRDVINKQGPHLSTARLNKQGFDLPGIAADVLREMVQFFDQLDVKRRKWFAKAELVARDALTRLPATSTGPRFGPANQPLPLGGIVVTTTN